jgi:hypothetical protein
MSHAQDTAAIVTNREVSGILSLSSISSVYITMKHKVENSANVRNRFRNWATKTNTDSHCIYAKGTKSDFPKLMGLSNLMP